MPYKIMLVEDEVELAIEYMEELEAEGYAVETVRDGLEAVEKVGKINPDLIIMDINLPKLDGIEAMWNILSKNNQIPIIINTWYDQYRDDFMTWGAEAYLVKRQDLTELKDSIKKALQRRKGQKPE